MKSENNKSDSMEKELFLETGRSFEDVVESQMFGKPCFKIKGKAFICFFQNEMVFKLNGDYHSEALSFDGTQLFDPSGKNRPMKEWVQIPFEYSKSWEKLALQALKYVSK